MRERHSSTTVVWSRLRVRTGSPERFATTTISESRYISSLTTQWIHIFGAFRHTRGVRIVQINGICGAMSDIDSMRRRISPVDPDLIVVTGVSSSQGANTDYGAIARTVAGLAPDVLWLPGRYDDRTSFENAFGRRYRLNSTGDRLDRTATIGGFTMVLLDNAEGAMSDDQQLWLRSLLFDLRGAIVKGASVGRVLIWSYAPIIREDRSDGSTEPEVEMLAHFSRGVSITVLCANPKTEQTRVSGHIIQYECPPLSRTSDRYNVSNDQTVRTGFRIVSIESNGEIDTAVVYSTDDMKDG